MTTTHTPIRAVLVATHIAEQDLGTPHDMPSCLLPCGTQTLVERMLDQFAHSGLKNIDLIVSDQPDELRKVIGHGERWGLRITWHWVQSGASSYSVLRSFDWHGVQKVLFARAEQWISDRALVNLIEAKNLVLVRADQPNVWTGWACCDKETVSTLIGVGHTSELGILLQAHSNTARKIILREDWAAPVSAADIVQLQQRALNEEGLDSAPATWIRKPWGIMSPQAWVDPKAIIRGPAIVGPGCFVSADAQIGPNTVLTKDVIVDNEVRIADSLAMPGVYFGQKTELRHTLVVDHRVLHIKTHTLSHLPEIRAHRQTARTETPTTGWLSRGLACAGLALLAPIAGFDWLTRKAMGLPQRWNTQPVVHGHLAHNAGLRVLLLNEPAPQSDLAGICFAQYGRLIDIAQGKRHWFGVRARTMSQWQHLSPDWQNLLARTPIGLIHASAWHEAGQRPTSEAQAAADVFYAVSPGWKTRLRICTELLRGSLLPNNQVQTSSHA